MSILFWKISEKIKRKILPQNGIDVTQMDSFRIMGIFDYLEQYERFPYEAFDNTFSEIYQKEKLGDLLLAYARLYADEIFG